MTVDIEVALKLTVVDKVPTIDSRVMAQGLGIQHKSFMQLVNDNQTEIEQDFGHLRFKNETVKNSVGARNQRKYVLLDYDQSLYVLALAQNTPQARYLKRQLVKAFIAMEKQLANKYDFSQFDQIDEENRKAEKFDSLTNFLKLAQDLQADRQELYDLENDLTNLQRKIAEQQKRITAKETTLQPLVDFISASSTLIIGS